MNMRNSQSGMTMISWIILIGLIGFVGIFGFKLIPIYLEYNSINNALATAAKNATTGETPAQIRSNIDNLFDVNSINDIKASDIDISTDPDTKAMVMTLDYNPTTNFIANIDLVVHFHKTYAAGH
jgi:Flp pilus assembly protein TadG